MSGRKLRVKCPRICRKGKGLDREVAIPAYESMRANESLGSRVLEILLAGVSTRNYRKALPQVAGTVGLSKSSVSREFIEASAEELKQLCEKQLEDETFEFLPRRGISKHLAFQVFRLMQRSQCGRELAGGHGRDVYLKPLGFTSDFDSRCPATTNIIESPNGGVRRRTGRGSCWKNGKMVLRWAASAFLSAEKNFREDYGLQRPLDFRSRPGTIKSFPD